VTSVRRSALLVHAPSLCAIRKQVNERAFTLPMPIDGAQAEPSCSVRRVACAPGRRDAQLFHIRPAPARGWPGSVVRRSLPGLSLALSPGDVRTVARQIRDRSVQALAEGMPGEGSPGNPSQHDAAAHPLIPRSP